MSKINCDFVSNYFIKILIFSTLEFVKLEMENMEIKEKMENGMEL
jgi:hypothetical protein